MNSYSIKIFTILALFITSCGSSNKQAQDSGNSKDSLTHNNDSMPKPPPPAPGLSPGHAKINGTILSITDVKNQNSKKNLIFQIEQVVGYGSATPVLSSGDTLDIAISNDQIEHIPSPEAKTEVTLLIQHQQTLSVGDSKNDIWIFRKLITD